MNFLIVDDEISIRQILVICIESIFKDARIFEASNSVDAIKLFSNNFHVDAVITDFEMPGGNGDILIHFLMDNNFPGKVILLTSNELSNLDGISESLKELIHIYIQKPVTYKELVQTFKSYFNVKTSAEYSPIRIAYFLRYNKTLVDIFLGIDNRFLKIINQDDFYDKRDIDKYISKDVKYLYVKNSDIELFTDRIGKTKFLQYDEVEEKLSAEDSLSRIHFVLKDIIQSVGVDSTVVELSEVYFKEIDKIDNKLLSSILFNIRNRRDYLYDHSFLTACLSNFIVKQMSWYNISMTKKLSFAALFHDIALNSSQIALSHDLSGEDLKKFSIEELSAFKNHPQKACDLIKDTKLFDPDIVDIIISHHEKLDGSGFPRRLSGKNIKRLSCVFILSHEFVRLMYLQNFEEKSHKDILTYLFNTYGSGNFKDILDALYATLTLNKHYKD